MPSDPAPPNDLVSKLKGIANSSLEEGVEKTEGVNGSTVEPVYSSRKMHCYSVTESELQQIGLANIGITAFFTIGSAMLAFWLDIFKDTVLAESVPETAEMVVSFVQPVLLFLGLLFWGIGIIAIYWRRNMIKLIKSESSKP